MIEFVYRQTRIIDGKRAYSRLFYGRYAVEKGAKPMTVCMNTPDRDVARKRLREIVLEKQREAEGIIAPKAVRVAAATQLARLVDNCEADLRGRELNHGTFTTRRGGCVG